jgi:hypothetical protein
LGSIWSERRRGYLTYALLLKRSRFAMWRQRVNSKILQKHKKKGILKYCDVNAADNALMRVTESSSAKNILLVFTPIG